MKNKILIINSFKGGAGKTTISLSYAITAAIDSNCPYKRVFYIDVDLLGTGSKYLLYGDNKFPKEYFGMNFKKEDVHKYIDKYDFVNKSGTYNFCCSCINPKNEYTSVSRNSKMFENNTYARDNLFVGCLQAFIDSIIKENETVLIVLDCSPGFDEREASIIENLRKNLNSNFDIEEIFVSTMDSNHLKKTLECLKTYVYRSISTKRHLIINSIYDLNKYVDLREIWEINKQNIIKEMDKINVSVYQKEYDEQICRNSLYGCNNVVKNLSDFYIIIGNDIYTEIIQNKDCRRKSSEECSD